MKQNVHPFDSMDDAQSEPGIGLGMRLSETARVKLASGGGSLPSRHKQLCGQDLVKRQCFVQSLPWVVAWLVPCHVVNELATRADP